MCNISVPVQKLEAYYDFDKQVGIYNTVFNSMLSNCVLFFSGTVIISLFVRFFFTVKSKVGNLMTEVLIFV